MSGLAAEPHAALARLRLEAGPELHGPINLGNPVELSLNEIVSLVAETVGSDAGIRHIPAVVDDPQRRCPDISRAVQRLDWRPLVQLEEGLKQTISWFAEREAHHL